VCVGAVVVYSNRRAVGEISKCYFIRWTEWGGAKRGGGGQYPPGTLLLWVVI